MRICGLEKMSLVDYDGLVSATVFAPSCNFKCGFCHNSLLVVGHENLPTISEQEVLDYLAKRKGILDGVCVSGGEPTLQKDLPLFIEKIKNLGYKVKLDTNGTNPEIIKTLFDNALIDYVAMDIKNDKDNYAKIIGFDKFDTVKVEKSVDFLMNSGYDYEFRTTLINEYHKEQNIRAIASWIKGAKKYFLQKFKGGDHCISQGLSPVSDEDAMKFIEILSKDIPTAKLRGYDV